MFQQRASAGNLFLTDVSALQTQVQTVLARGQGCDREDLPATYVS